MSTLESFKLHRPEEKNFIESWDTAVPPLGNKAFPQWLNITGRAFGNSIIRETYDDCFPLGDDEYALFEHVTALWAALSVDKTLGEITVEPENRSNPYSSLMVKATDGTADHVAYAPGTNQGNLPYLLPCLQAAVGVRDEDIVLAYPHKSYEIVEYVNVEESGLLRVNATAGLIGSIALISQKTLLVA